MTVFPSRTALIDSYWCEYNRLMPDSFKASFTSLARKLSFPQWTTFLWGMIWWWAMRFPKSLESFKLFMKDEIFILNFLPRSTRRSRRESDYYKTNLLMPLFKVFTLKFINNPTFTFESFIYVKIWASWIGWILSTHFNSTISWFLINKSIRYPQEIRTFLYLTGNSASTKNYIPAWLNS